MKDFLDFDLKFLYFGMEAEAMGRVIDRLLFYDYPKEHRHLMDDIRFLRMAFFYYISNDKKDILSIDDDLKGYYKRSIDRIVNLFRFSDEIDNYLGIDIDFLIRIKKTVCEN